VISETTERNFAHQVPRVRYTYELAGCKGAVKYCASDGKEAIFLCWIVWSNSYMTLQVLLIQDWTMNVSSFAMIISVRAECSELSRFKTIAEASRSHI
jgi:hypothetical protein